MAKSRSAKRNSSLHHSVAQDIGARILRGEFGPGQLLPNEAACGQMYKVSRTAIREAMKMLTAKGLIVSRPKIGSRVCPRDNWNLLDREVLGWYCAAADLQRFLTSTQQLREILEPETAALAALHHTPAQLDEIERALHAMKAATSLEEWNRADVLFHLSILRAAGNDLLLPFGMIIESALSNLFNYTARNTEDTKKAWPIHAEVFDAIRRRRPDAARRAVRKLLDNTNRIISDGVAAKATSGDRKKAAERTTI